MSFPSKSANDLATPSQFAPLPPPISPICAAIPACLICLIFHLHISLMPTGSASRHTPLWTGPNSSAGIIYMQILNSFLSPFTLRLDVFALVWKQSNHPGVLEEVRDEYCNFWGGGKGEAAGAKEGKEVWKVREQRWADGWIRGWRANLLAHFFSTLVSTELYLASAKARLHLITRLNKQPSFGILLCSFKCT